ncbi:putative membrane protein, partial [Bacteroides fragilis str. 34-F-2 
MVHLELAGISLLCINNTYILLLQMLLLYEKLLYA